MGLLGCRKDKNELEPAPEITLNKSSLILEIGKSERLEASFNPSDTEYDGHTWTSSLPLVASVDDTGMVTAKKVGTCTITAKTLYGGNKATCEVTVVEKQIKVTGISLNKTEETMLVDETLNLVATIKPDDATNQAVTWSTSSHGIATVDNNGTVTAVSAGSAIIKATTVDGEKVASCKIQVQNRGVDISKVTVENIGSTSALIIGSITPKGVGIKEMGICYVTSQSPTIEGNKVVLSGEEIAYTLKNLSPNTVYYVRLYAIVDDVPKYGDQAYFTTEVPVEISTPKVSSITSNSAYITGLITTYGMKVEESGIVYSTSSMPTTNNDKVVISENNIAYTLMELNAATSYYVRIYAKVNGETHYSEQAEFVTLEELKTQFKVTDYYTDKLIIESPAQSGYEKIDICYSTNEHPKITDNIMSTTAENGVFKFTISGLSSNTTYYIRPYIMNGSQVKYLNDEIKLTTIGSRDFNIEWVEIVDIDGGYYNGYDLIEKYKYSILDNGTYKMSITNFGELGKDGTNFSKVQYIEQGTGNFYLKRTGGSYFYSSHMLYFYTDTHIQFEHIETGIRLHWIIGGSRYIKDL